MAQEDLKLDLDPKKVLEALRQISTESKKLSEVMEEQLGKNSAKSVDKLEQASEKGANKITATFRNLSQRVREDLKTAFNVGQLVAGFKLGETVAAGVKQVFEMERAFDRLNSRLKLTGRGLQDFKNAVGTASAKRGQSVEDILPGVESAAAKGGIKEPGQLAQIADVLAQVRSTTGEDTGSLSEQVVEIMKQQGMKMTAQSFKQVMDAVQGTRTAGAFHTAGEAAGAIQGITAGISPDQQRAMGLGTRQAGGLAAAASRSGDQGQSIIQKILQAGTTAGGQERINAILGQQVFNKGKIDVSALQKVQKGGLGKYTEQVRAEALGTDQAGLARFLDQMKEGMADFKKVSEGANETADEFDTATDNLASKVDQFKQKTIEAGREVGGSISKLLGDVVAGKGGNLAKDLGGVAKAVGGNIGGIAGGVGAAGLAALLTGGGIRGLLGAGAAKAAGIEPVFVTNADQIGGGVSSKLAGALGGFSVDKLIPKGVLGKLASAASGYGLAGQAGALGAVGAAGYGVGSAIQGAFGDQIADAVWSVFGDNTDENLKAQGFKVGGPGEQGTDPNAIAKAVEKGAHDGTMKSKAGVPLTNPSLISGRGVSQ